VCEAALTTSEFARSRASGMNSLQRSISSLLCLAIAMGYAPAWLHVSLCHDHHTSAPDGKTPTSSCAGTCSHTQANTVGLKDTVGSKGTVGSKDSDSQPSKHEHDSDTCFVCQSLGNANGLTLEWDTVLASTIFCEPSLISIEFTFVSPSLSIAEARGPPALV